MTASPSLAAMALQTAKISEWRDLIHREALKMTSSLRPILSQSGVRSQLAKRFLGQFNELLSLLRSESVVEDFTLFLMPWKSVLECQEVTGAFIHAALLSMRAFLRANLFTDPQSPLPRSFIHELMFVVASARFETTVLDADEVIMGELIDFMAEVVAVNCVNPVSEANLVGDAFIFQFIDLLFVMLNQARFSELLRSKAVEVATVTCTRLFSLTKKLSSFEEISENAPKITFPNVVKIERSQSMNAASNSQSAGIKSPRAVANNSNEFVEVSTTAESSEATQTESVDPFSESTVSESFDPFANEEEQELAPDVVEEVMRFRARLAGVSLEESQSSEGKPNFFLDSFTGNCLTEILLFLTRSIDCIEAAPKKAPGSLKAEPAPTKVLPSPKTQVAALKCLLAIFTEPESTLSREFASQPNQLEQDLLDLIGDVLLKNLLAILAFDHSSRHLSAISQLLLAIFTHFRVYFVSQFECFLSICLSIVGSRGQSTNVSSAANQNKPTIPRPTQLALTTVCLEMLSFFLTDPSIITQIFVVYECSPDFPNTLEALSKNVAAGMEKSGGNEEIAALSGEILCNFIKTIESGHDVEQGANLNELLQRRRVKMIYKEAAVLFNAAPKEGFAFLQEQGLLGAEPTASEIANFLRTAQGLDKKNLGEYLVKPNNIEILREFFSAFHFSPETSIDSALRQVLESFRLPGEAQQIDRIMECFAAVYYPAAKSVFVSQDACYVLAFSTLMLNTDLHNPQVKHKMSLPDFLRNNRGINDGQDVDEVYLTRLYHSIRTREIVMPEEHGGEEAFSSQWNEVQRRAELLRSEKIPINIPLGPLVPGIVEIVWKPIITSLIPFINQQRPTGDLIPEGPLNALRGIASLFEKFEMAEALEALLGNIWSVSNLIPVFSAASGNMIPRYLARLPGFRQVVQLIVDMYVQQGPSLQSSWINYCRLLIMFAESGLIDHSLVMRGDQLQCGQHTVSLIQLMKLAREARQVQPSSQKSFISSISARFFGNDSSNQNRARESPESPTSPPFDEFVLAARNFVAELPLTGCLEGNDSVKSFTALRDALLNHIKWNAVTSPTTGKRTSVNATASLNWTEETLIVLVEAVTALLLANPESFSFSWPTVFTCFSRLVLQNPSPPARLCEHVIISLGRIVLQQAPQASEDVLADYFKFWCQLSPSLHSSTLEPFLAIVACILERQTLDQSSTLWPSLFTILSSASKHDTAAPFNLRLFQLIVGSEQTGKFFTFSMDFFTEFVDLLTGMTLSLTVSASTTPLVDPWRGGDVQRAEVSLQAIRLLETAQGRLKQDPSEATWSAYSVPLLNSLAVLSTQPAKTGRLEALNAFSRALPHQGNYPAGQLFSRVLFPMLKSVAGMPAVDENVAMRSASLACKTFLLYLPQKSDSSTSSLLVPLWKELLEHLHPLLTGPTVPESVRESVLESCKNVLLVMLSTPGMQQVEEIWRVTGLLIGGVAPEWRAELELRLNATAEETKPEPVILPSPINEPIIEAVEPAIKPVETELEPIKPVDSVSDAGIPNFSVVEAVETVITPVEEPVQMTETVPVVAAVEPVVDYVPEQTFVPPVNEPVEQIVSGEVVEPELPATSSDLQMQNNDFSPSMGTRQPDTTFEV